MVRKKPKPFWSIVEANINYGNVTGDLWSKERIEGIIIYVVITRWEGKPVKPLSNLGISADANRAIKNWQRFIDVVAAGR